MIEVNENEYVRTNKGYIFKIAGEKKSLQVANFPDVEYGKIVKHSKQIADIINIKDICMFEKNCVYIYYNCFLDAVKENIKKRK